MAESALTSDLVRSTTSPASARSATRARASTRRLCLSAAASMTSFMSASRRAPLVRMMYT